MGWPYLVSFRKDVTVVEEAANRITINAPLGTQQLVEVSPGLVAAIRAMAERGANEDKLADIVLSVDASALPRLYFELNRWKKWNILRYAVADGDRPTVAVEPISTSFRLDGEAPASGPCTLSRFAYMRRFQGELVLESPLSHARTIVHHPLGLSLIGALVTSLSRDMLIGEPPGVRGEALEAALGLLRSAGLLTSPEAEEDDSVLMQWAFHDLLFHARSRIGRHDYPFG